MRRIKYGSGCVISLAAALMVVLTGPVVSAWAAWQAHEIKVGDGQGGFITLPAQRQVINRPGGNYLLAHGLANMGNDKITMVASWHDGSSETPVIAFSDDAGATWSPFEGLTTHYTGSLSRPMALTYLGDGKLSYVGGYKRYFSYDYGQTWPDSVDRQPLMGTVAVGIEGSVGVDRDANGNATRVMEINYYWVYGFPNGYPHDAYADAYFRYSEDDGRTWQGDATSPNWEHTETYKDVTYNRGVSEGSVIRAANGDLVAALRTDMPPRYFVDWGYDDSLEGTGVSISKDNGQTWSEINVLFRSGRHHADLRRLPNGDLVMTVIVRDDIRDPDDYGGYDDTPLDSPMRGMDALVSRDNGLTWNLDHRVTLDEFEYYNPGLWYNGRLGHLGATLLDDGSMLAFYGNYRTGNPVLIKWDPSAVLGPRIEGDLDGDGFVGGSDLDIVRSFWGQTVTPGSLAHGDPSGNGIVSGQDLDIVRAHWGEGTPPAVPEQSALILLAGALALSMGCRFKQRRRNL